MGGDRKYACLASMQRQLFSVHTMPKNILNGINAFIIWCVISVSFWRRLSVRSGNFVYNFFSF